MTLKLDRVISITTLVVLVVAVVLLLKRPVPVAQEPKPAAGTAANVQPVNSPTLDQKPDPVGLASMPAQQSSQAAWQAQSSAGNSAPSLAITSAVPQAQNLPASQSAKAAESHATSNTDAIGAAINQMLGASAGSAALSPESEVGSGAPNIKDQKVTYEGDTVHGQFLTEIGGRDVWVTISGHMGQKDGYATFDPTEFKVGDVNVPVALVNPALQRKLAEERDRLKLSDSK
jgi:hypothetical protein